MTIRCGILPIATMVTMGETNTTVALATDLTPHLLTIIYVQNVCQLANHNSAYNYVKTTDEIT